MSQSKLERERPGNGHSLGKTHWNFHVKAYGGEKFEALDIQNLTRLLILSFQ